MMGFVVCCRSFMKAERSLLFVVLIVPSSGPDESLEEAGRCPSVVKLMIARGTCSGMNVVVSKPPM